MNMPDMKIKFDLGHITRYVLYVLLFLIPFGTRKVFLTQYSFFSGSYNEYVTYSLYLTDLIVVSLFALLLVQCTSDIVKRFMVKSASGINNILAVFLIWIALSITANMNYFEVSAYQAVRMAEYVGLAVIIRHIVNTKKRLLQSLFIISFSGFVQGAIALVQFYFQSSIFGTGISHKLSGESIISTNIIGTSNIVYDGVKIIRSYGTFTHPNVLAGFLVVTMLITLFLYTLMKSNAVFSVIYNTKHKECQGSCGPRLLLFLLFVQFSALVATMSRAAMVSLFIIALVNVFIFKIVPRETFFSELRSYFHKSNPFSRVVRVFFAGILSALLIASSIFFLFRITNEFTNHQSFQDRILLQDVSRGTIYENPVFGTGIGTYVLILRDNYSSRIMNYWQYQPDHNLFLLIASEIGLIGLAIYLFVMYSLYKLIDSVCEQISIYDRYLKLLFKSLIVVVLVLGLFDHYFWTSHQAKMLMWIMFGLLISYVSIKNVPRGTFLK